MPPCRVPPLWREGDTAATVAMRVVAQLSFGKARLVHAEIGKLLKQTEDIRRKASEQGKR